MKDQEYDFFYEDKGDTEYILSLNSSREEALRES